MLEIMAGATGLEPATFGVTGRRSNQLSYAPAGALGLRRALSEVKEFGPKSRFARALPLPQNPTR